MNLALRKAGFIGKIKVLLALSGAMVLSGFSEAAEVSDSNGYFNTARSQKIAGVLINDPSQVNEVVGFSNAVGFWTTKLSQVTAFLRQNKGRLLPVLELRSFIFDPATGVVREDYLPVIENLARTITRSHSGPVLFLVDEPFWNIRLSCYDKGLPQACAEIRAHYSNTLSQIRIAGKLLRQALPGSGVFGVEAFAELAIQQSQWGQLVMLDDAEYLAFDCYGDFESCGGGTYAGVSISAQPMTTYMTWVSETIASLESKNPIGRKLILVPGSFVNTVDFVSEEQTIAHLRSYLRAFDSCPLCGGFTPFLWGNLPGIHDTIVGARSLPNVRSALINALRSFTQTTSQVPPPAMTLVGGYQMNPNLLSTVLGTPTKSLLGTPATADLLGIPEHSLPNPPPLMGTLSVPSGASGRVYVTNAGMDSCSITIGSGVAQALAANTLSMTLVPRIINETMVKATCVNAGALKAYSQYFLFKVQSGSAHTPAPHATSYAEGLVYDSGVPVMAYGGTGPERPGYWTGYVSAGDNQVGIYFTDQTTGHGTVHDPAGNIIYTYDNQGNVTTCPCL